MEFSRLLGEKVSLGAHPATTSVRAARRQVRSMRIVRDGRVLRSNQGASADGIGRRRLEHTSLTSSVRHGKRNILTERMRVSYRTMPRGLRAALAMRAELAVSSRHCSFPVRGRRRLPDGDGDEPEGQALPSPVRRPGATRGRELLRRPWTIGWGLNRCRR